MQMILVVVQKSCREEGPGEKEGNGFWLLEFKKQNVTGHVRGFPRKRVEFPIQITGELLGVCVQYQGIGL